MTTPKQGDKFRLLGREWRVAWINDKMDFFQARDDENEKIILTLLVSDAPLLDWIEPPITISKAAGMELIKKMVEVRKPDGWIYAPRVEVFIREMMEKD